jgi:ABC-type nitrate/sulfonate/bicarbonate transport system permease component
MNQRESRVLVILQKWWLVLALIVLWQAASSLSLWSANLLPSPAGVVRACFNMAVAQVLFRDIAASVLRVVCGFTIAAIAGTSLGLFLAVERRLAPPFRHVIELLRPIPPIAWIPLAILWFGIGNSSAIFIVAIGAFFPIVLNTFEAVSNVKMLYINTAFCLGANRSLLLTDILLPAAAPQILIGLRIGLGIAWTSLIAAELIGAQSGLGYMIQLNRLILQMENVIAGMIVIGLIGLSMNSLARRVERSLVPWATDTLRTQAI